MLNKLNPLQWFRARSQKPSRDQAYSAFRFKYERFKELLDSNSELSKIMVDMEDKLQGHRVFGMSHVRSQSARAIFHTMRMIQSLNAISRDLYPTLLNALDEINLQIKGELEKRKESSIHESILPYFQISREMVDWVGGKNANLGEVLSRVGLPIPEGFAITTHAFDFFMKANDLIDDINKVKMEIDPNIPETITMASEEIQRLIIAAPLPAEIEEPILAAYDQMIERIKAAIGDDFSRQVSLRSSAIGEDSELSFAGQYLSVLNVPRDKLARTYKFVLASLFTPRAISYRLSKGISHESAAMSVACLQMVDSVASGVVYSHHPFNLLEENIIINAVWGLGPYAVDGVITPDTYTVAKTDPLTILESKISTKPVKLMSRPEGGLLEVPVPEEARDRPCLTEEQIKTLAEYSLALERHYGHPQDTEWALDRHGRIIILQTRPLMLSNRDDANTGRTTPLMADYPLLLEGGAVASPAWGSVRRSWSAAMTTS